MRLAFDHHAAESTHAYLGGNEFPVPNTPEGRKQYIGIDDWKIFEFINKGQAGRHGDALLKHQHDRCVDSTDEVAKPDQVTRHETLLNRLREQNIDAWEASAGKSRYKVDSTEIQIAVNNDESSISSSRSLSKVSNIVGKITPNSQRLIFVPAESRKEAKGLLTNFKKE